MSSDGYKSPEMDLESEVDIEELLMSPTHYSPEQSEPEPSQPDAPPPPPSNRMGGAFPGLLQAANDDMVEGRERIRLEREAGSGRDWKIPVGYVQHWERVPDALKNVPIHPRTYFRVPCMVPAAEHKGKMYTTSKCFEMLFENDVRLLAGPTMGQTYCFVEECMTDIPLHIQKVLYFFDSLRTNISREYSTYVFPCTDVGLLPDRGGSKSIPGLVTNGLKNEPDEATQQRRTRDAGGKIRISDVLRERYLDQPEELKKPVPALTIHTGFTGALFNDGGVEKRKNYAFAMITCTANVAMWPYIYEKFLSPPKLGSPNFDASNKIHLEMKFTLDEILRHEIFCNLGVTRDEFGMPEDYVHTAGGCLGTLTTLSPFNLPFKINNRIRTEYPQATDVRIGNMPKLEFEWDDELTSDLISAMNDSITANQRLDARKMEALERYNLAKEKKMFEDVQLDAAGGWPLDIAPDGSVTAFGLPPLPLMMEFDSHGARGSFHVWSSGVGALPDLVSALLRSFLSESGPLDASPEIGHFLRDRRHANPVLVLKTYFGTEVDAFKSLVLVDSHKRLFESLVRDNGERRKKGASVGDILRAVENYIGGTVKTLESMIMAGVFRSDTIRHKLDIVNSINFEEVCKTSADSIRTTVNEKRSHMPTCRRYDEFQTVWHAFMDTWREMNQFFSLNSANLVCAFEVMVSQLMHMFGDTNKTWTFFFATILVMSGNGHFQIYTKEGVVMDTRKPNTTGLDFLLARLTEIWTALYKNLNISKSERLNILLNCARFTETAWENIVTATATNGVLVALPEKSITDRSMAIPELRANSLQSILQHVCPRGEGAETASFNSCDMDKTGARSLAKKEKIDNAGICIMASNLMNDTKKKAEESKSAMVVTPSMVPGSGPAPPKRRRHNFNDVSKDSNTGRHQPLEKEDKFANLIAYSHNFAGLYGLIDRLGAVTIEINHSVSAFHDWVCFYLQQFCGGIMDKTVLESLDRMKQGYLSRGVVLAIHLKTIKALSTTEVDREETVKNLLMDLHVHALPVISVPSVLCCMMSRAVHMGSLLMISVIAQHLSVPVISWKSLKQFFADDVLPTEEGIYMDEVKQIHDFVKECIQGNRFCPEDDGPMDFDSNVSCYITGDGKVDYTPANVKQGLLSVPFSGKDKNEEDGDVFHKIATRISDKHGSTLFRTCHMGPETCVIKYALEYLVAKFLPDFRGILSPNTFHSKKHLLKLGLLAHLPGMKDYDSDETPPFAKQCCFKVGNEIRSVAVGVNIWSLLIMSALMKDPILHPDVSNSVSKSLVEEMLSNAPEAFTPGLVTPIRDFNLHSVQVEKLYTQSGGRPKHLLRPAEASFVTTGILSIARGYKRYLPEDMAHCSFLSSLADMLFCDILEVPAKAVKSSYELMPNFYYSFHAPNDPQHKYGTVRVNVSEEEVDVSFLESIPAADPSEIGSTYTTLAFDKWEQHIAKNDYVITPMICRKGACVLVQLSENESTLGCLVSYPDHDNSQFNYGTCEYQALIDAQNTVSQIFFLDALKWLVPVGEILYLNMDILDIEAYRRQGGEGKLLYTRLNVPPMAEPEEGKLYVTCMRKIARTRKEQASVSSVTFAVNPWDVQLASRYTGDPKLIVQHLK